MHLRQGDHVRHTATGQIGVVTGATYEDNSPKPYLFLVDFGDGIPRAVRPGRLAYQQAEA